jgi:hypothetical protein
MLNSPDITVVGEADLPELMPMLRSYCDFYRVDPSDEKLAELSRALIADPGNRMGFSAMGRLGFRWDSRRSSGLGRPCTPRASACSTTFTSRRSRGAPEPGAL